MHLAAALSALLATGASGFTTPSNPASLATRAPSRPGSRSGSAGAFAIARRKRTAGVGVGAGAGAGGSSTTRLFSDFGGGWDPQAAAAGVGWDGESSGGGGVGGGMMGDNMVRRYHAPPPPPPP